MLKRFKLTYNIKLKATKIKNADLSYGIPHWKQQYPPLRSPRVQLLGLWLPIWPSNQPTSLHVRDRKRRLTVRYYRLGCPQFRWTSLSNGNLRTWINSWRIAGILSSSRLRPLKWVENEIGKLGRWGLRIERFFQGSHCPFKQKTVQYLPSQQKNPQNKEDKQTQSILL